MSVQGAHRQRIAAFILLLLCLPACILQDSDAAARTSDPSPQNADASIQPILGASHAPASAAAVEPQPPSAVPSDARQQEQPRPLGTPSQAEPLAQQVAAALSAGSRGGVGHVPHKAHIEPPSQPLCPLPGLQDLLAAAAGAQRAASSSSDVDAAQQQGMHGVCAMPSSAEAAAAAQLAEQAAAAAAKQAAAAAATSPTEATDADEDVHDRHNFASAKDGAKVLAANKEAKVCTRHVGQPETPGLELLADCSFTSDPCVAEGNVRAGHGRRHLYAHRLQGGQVADPGAAAGHPSRHAAGERLLGDQTQAELSVAAAHLHAWSDGIADISAGACNHLRTCL
jgi:hypothetical protein